MYSDNLCEFKGASFEELPEWVRQAARVLRPGTLISADVQASRLNVCLDEYDNVTLIYWG